MSLVSPLVHLAILLQATSIYNPVTLSVTYYVLTYLLTPWCRVLLEKLTGLQLVKKFLSFHGTRRFITALTSVRHLSLSWASPIQSIYPHPTSWRSMLILSTHLRLGLPSGLCYIIHRQKFKIKSRRTRWAVHVARTEVTNSTYMVSVEK